MYCHMSASLGGPYLFLGESICNDPDVRRMYQPTFICVSQMVLQ